MAPEYKGEEYYMENPSVSSGSLITANGAGMTEFACEIFDTFQIMDPKTIENVSILYKSGGINNRLY